MIAKLLPLTDILDLLPDAVCVLDSEGRLLFVSASFQSTFGYTREDVLGRQILDFVHPDDHTLTLQQADKVMGGTLQRHFRNRYIHKSGHSVDIQWSAHWNAEYGVRIAVAREVTDLRRAERELEHLASHDLLTGLSNRHRLQHELQRALDHATQSNGRLALLYLDLDGFKAVNDRAGHEAGDRVLREVAARLQQSVRQGDLVARVGGDEFVVLLPGCRDSEAAREIVNGLRARIRTPYAMPDGLLQLDASIGIACFPGDGNDRDTLLAHADRAMYADKRLQTAQASLTPM